jgi:hypothetical protein
MNTVPLFLDTKLWKMCTSITKWAQILPDITFDGGKHPSNKDYKYLLKTKTSAKMQTLGGHIKVPAAIVMSQPILINNDRRILEDRIRIMFAVKNLHKLLPV